MRFNLNGFPAPGPLPADRRTILICCVLVFLFTVGVRCLDAGKWDHPSLVMEVPGLNHSIDREYIMGTHDAYYWLAGAERIGSASDSAMSVFLDVTSRITKIPDGILAFWAPALASSLVAVVGFLWGRMAGGTGVGLFTALISGLFPGFYFRTRLGYYDTDIATLLFPLAVGLGLAWWLDPAIRVPWLKSSEERREPARPVSSYAPFWLGVFAAFGAWWHGDIGKFNLVTVWLALGLILALVPRQDKGKYLLGLALFTLTALGGWPGLLAGLLFSWAWDRWPQFLDTVTDRYWVGLLLVALALVGTNNLVYPVQYLAAKLSAYMKPLAQEGATGTLTYPSITQSVVEAQNIPLWDILDRMMPWPWLSVVGLAGLALLTAVRPVVLFLAPLVVLSLLSVKIGARMSMFGGPGVALGVGVLLAWLLNALVPRTAWRKWALALVPAVLGLALLLPWLQVYLNAPPTPVLSKPHAIALSQLAELSTPNSQVWTWWDWGYATDYYAKRKSFADGGKHSGSRVFPVGLALISPSPLQSNQIIRFIAAMAKNGSDGSEEMSKRPPHEVQAFIDSLATTQYTIPRGNKQYLVVTWENFRLLYWISFYGSWNFVTKSGGHAGCVELNKPFSLDHQTGLLTLEGEMPMQLSSADVFTKEGKVRRTYNTGNGPHFIFNEFIQSGYIMNDDAYHSMAVQLLFADVNDPRYTPYFHLIWEGSPEVRIYEVL